MFKRFFAVILSGLMIFSALAGCGGSKDFPVTVGETEITKAPERVVCLSAAAASAVTALGFESSIVGAPTEYLNDNLGGADTEITDIGNAMMPDWDTVYETSPDAVIFYFKPNEDTLAALELRDIKAVYLETPQSYSKVAEYYESLAKIFLGNNTGKATADTYNSEVEQALAKIESANKNSAKKVAAFIEEGFLVTGDTLAGQAMKKVGFNNIADNETDYMMSAVEIATANPDVIFCAKDMSNLMLENEVYKDVTAVKNGAVYEIDASALLFAGEDFCAVLEAMSNYLNQ